MKVMLTDYFTFGSFGDIRRICAGHQLERPMAVCGTVCRPAGRLCLHHAKWLGP